MDTEINNPRTIVFEWFGTFWKYWYCLYNKQFLAHFYFLAIVNNASVYKFLLDIYLGMELLGYTVTKFNPMLRNYQTIFQSDFYISISTV